MQCAFAFFSVDDFENIFHRQRFEVEAIRSVVVRRHGFRVAIDHDRFIASVMQGKAGVAAAIVKLNALTDAVWAATEDDDFLLVTDLCFIAVRTGQARFIGRIHIGGGRGEFGGTGVDALVNRAHFQLAAMGRNAGFFYANEFAQALVGKAHGFQLPHVHGVVGQALLANGVFHFYQLFNLAQEPWLVFAALINLLHRCTVAEGLGDFQQAVWRGQSEGRANGILVVTFANARNGNFIHAAQACFKSAEGFLEGLLEGAANGHDFTN